MNPTVRAAVALIAGLFVAFGLVAAIEVIGHVVYPPPSSIDSADPARVSSGVELPAGALLFVLAAWITATFCGGFVAAKIEGVRPKLFAAIIGLVVLAAAISNFAVIPHPVWFMIAAVIAIPLAAWAAGRVAAPMVEI